MKLFHMCDEESWIGPDLETTKTACAAARNNEPFATEDLEDAREYTEAELDSILIDISEDFDGTKRITARELLASEIAEGGEFPRFAFGVDY
jgi:hypothetical protein